MSDSSFNNGNVPGDTRGVHDYPVIHGIHTHVIKYGELDDKKRLVLIIPGNPGAVEFYDEFMKTLHDESGWPVWGLSHAGHSTVPKHAGWQVPDGRVFTLEGQIEHKVYFINEYLPGDVEIVLIGHSVGAYVVLELMDRVTPDKITQGLLLFPTIEKMAVSPQGKRMTPLLKNFRWLFILISAMFWLLPRSWQQGAISWVFEKRKHVLQTTPPDCIQNAALNLLDPYCVDKATYMAHLEMQEVVDLKKDMVERHIPKLRFYYGATDHWCPKEHYHDMKAMFPDHDKIHLCEDGFRHAFIIDASEPMARKVSDWLAQL